MNTRTIALYITLLMFILLFTPYLFSAEKRDYLTVDEIKVGMKGYGLTVFKGTTISRFDVEILGVMKGAFPKQDMILARLSAPELTDIGVIAGMSGSPVYLEDKVIGAVAYGWTFAKEPICGITPITNMLEVMNLIKTGEKTSTAGVPIAEQQAALTANTEITINRTSLPTGSFDSLFRADDSIKMKPLSLPVSISNCNPLLMPRLTAFFEKYNMTPVISGRSGMGAESELNDVKIEPGSALGVQLMSGDMEATAIGTTTYVKDNIALGFGHPMMFGGRIEMPITTAYIYSIMPSVARPFKLGGTIAAAGSLREDRLPAIGAVLGEHVEMAPLSVSVTLPDKTTSRDYSYNVINNKLFTPSLVGAGIIESILSSYKEIGEHAAAMKYTVKLDDGTEYTKEDFVANTIFLSSALGFAVESDLDTLMLNPFKEVRVSNITYHVELFDTAKAASILSMQTDRDEYKPGETVTITMWVQPYREERKKIIMELTLPEKMNDGVYGIMALDGESRRDLEFSRAPGKGKPRTFEQLVEVLKLHYPGNKIYIAIQNPVPGMTIDGKEMEQVPASIRSTLMDVSAPGLVQETEGIIFTEQTIATEYAIYGKQGAKILVRQMKQY